MKVYQLLSLAAVILSAPHMNPLVATVLAVAALVLSEIFRRREP